MRDGLGVLLVEGGDGKVAVQLFERPEVMAESLGHLKGRVSDDPSRVTGLTVRWPEGGGVSVEAVAVDLPEPPETPWGWRVGEGPMNDPQEGGDADVS